MQYLVHTVEAHELPEGIDRVIVECDEGPPLLILARPLVWAFLQSYECDLMQLDRLEPVELVAV